MCKNFFITQQLAQNSRSTLILSSDASGKAAASKSSSTKNSLKSLKVSLSSTYEKESLMFFYFCFDEISSKSSSGKIFRVSFSIKSSSSFSGLLPLLVFKLYNYLISLATQTSICHMSDLFGLLLTLRHVSIISVVATSILSYFAPFLFLIF